MVCSIAVAAALVLGAAGAARRLPAGATTHNVQPVGYSDLDGRPGFKMAIREVSGRWYLYMGHLWHRGWSIVDVTDPRTPKLARFIPGPDNTWTIQMELHGDRMITALQQIPPGWGGDPNRSFDEGFLIWDIRDPLNPKKLGQYKTGGGGTHRNFYAGGRYVHAAAALPGYEGQIYVIVDIRDPTKPVEAGRWWVPGQHTAGGEKPPDPGISVHGPPYVVGDRAYLDYGAAGLYILDISDVARPRGIGHLDFSPPFNPRIGTHSVLPIPERNLLLANGEAIAENCGEPLTHASIVDIRDPARPTLMALFPLPTRHRGHHTGISAKKGAVRPA